MKEIKVGDDITMSWGADTKCFYVTKVIDQKHIFVHEYSICADHSKPGGMGHQEWLYFKSREEMINYLTSIYADAVYSDLEAKDEEWVMRYGKWNRVTRINSETYYNTYETIKKELEQMNVTDDAVIRELKYRLGITKEEATLILLGKECVKYTRLNRFSVGVRNYYYCWEL